MAVQTIYLLGTTAVTPYFWGNTQLNGSAPTAANSAFGWAPAKTAITTPYYRGHLGATATSTDPALSASYNASTSGPTLGTGTGGGAAGDCFVVGPLTGTFAATAWTFNFNMRAGTAGCIGHVNMKMYRSTNLTGAVATQLIANTAGATVTLSTTADANSSITASPGAMTLNNEYLFFQVEWQETTAGSSNNDNVFFRIGTSSFTTADLTITAGQGASAGVGAATGGGSRDVRPAGTATAGVGAATGGGRSDVRSLGTAAGIGAATAVGSSTTNYLSVGSASGTGTATGVGSSTTTTGLTPVIHSIGIGGTHDFTSLAAWAAALPADLVADGHPQIAQLYFNGTGDGEFLNSTSSTNLLYLTGHTTDSTHDITVTTGPGQSFRDNANAQTNPLTYDATKGVGLRVNTGYTGLIAIGDRYTTLANLQIYMDGGNSDCIGDTSKIDLQINDCLIVHRSFYNASNAVKTFSSGQSTLNMRNCCVVANPQNAGTYNYLAIFSFNYINLYNCTIVVPPDSPGAGANTYATFIQYGQTSNIASNCAIFGFAHLCRTDTNLFASVITSATDQASPPTGFTGSLTYASQFVDTTLTGGYDFRPSPTGFLPGHGTADTTNAVTDIVGTTRPQGTGWDIGCWEYKVPVTIHSVGIGGTHDYTSLAAWAAALPADLVADGHRQEVQLYFNGSGDGEFVATYNTRILYLVGHNTDIAHNITVTTGPGQSFRDNAGVQTNPLTYDVTKGVALACHSLLYTGIIQVEDINVTLSNLQIYMDNGNVHAVYVPTSTPGVQLIINDCLIIAKGTASNVTAIQVYDSGAYLTVTNSCVVLDPLTATGNQAAIYTGFGADLYSCTIVLPQGGASGGVNTYGTWSQYGSGGTAGIIKNCAVFGFSNLYNPSVPFTNITTCATDLASPPTGFTGSLVYADQFIDNNVTGGYDFRPKSTGFLPDHGTIDTINALYDIVGTARPQGTTTDIGCWELVAAADAGAGTAAGHGLAAAVSPPPDHGIGSASGVGTATGVSPVVLVPAIHWKLSDGSGADLIGSGNTGIFHGGATPTTVGPMGNAVILDGSTGYVINNQVINIPYVSLSVWIKTTATTSSSFIGGFANGLGSGVTDKILSINALSVPVWYIYNGGTSNNIAGTVAINDGNWHHVVGTYDGVNQNLYFDGVLNNTIAAAGASYTGYNTPNVLLGGYSGGAPNWLPGTFDDFQVFDRALTATEVSSLFAQGVIPGAGSVGSASGHGLAAAQSTTGGGVDTYAVGSSSGLGTVLAGGSSDARSAIASAGLGTATASDKSDAATVGSTFGTGTAAGKGSSDVRSIGSASGLGSANGTDKEDSSAIGNSAGVGNASGVIFADLRLVGSASGLGSVNGQGKSDIRSVGQCNTNVGTAAGIGKDDFTASGSAAGVGSANAISLGGIGLVGYAPGVATVTGVAKSDAYGSGSAAGLGTVAAVIFDDGIGVGNAHGQGNAVALADTGSATGTAHGQGSATAVGNAGFISVASASGVGTATTTAISDARCIGTAAGVGSATATSYFTTERFSTGSAAGIGTAVSSGRSDYAGAGSSAGIGNATATSVVTLNSLITGAAFGQGVANGVAASDARAIGNSSGVGTATGIAGATSLVTIGEADGVGTATAVGNAGFSVVGNAAGTSIVTAISFMSYGVIGHSTGFGLAAARSTSDDETIGNASGIGLAVGRGSGTVVDWIPAAPGTIPIAPPDRYVITDELDRIVKASRGRRVISVQITDELDRIVKASRGRRVISVQKTPRRIV